MKWLMICCLLFPGFVGYMPVSAQPVDSSHPTNKSEIKYRPRFLYKIAHNKYTVSSGASYIIPAAAMLYGVGSMTTHRLKKWNTDAKYELYTEHPHNNFRADDYLQFAPAVCVYGLNATGIKGRNNLRDITMLYVMSNLILNTTVYSLKHVTHEWRPDNSDHYSFPSGHTAEAFASAEFLWQEYKDVSPWYGVAGYAVAASTGFLRMYNNKHWLGDIVAGAGVGMASTKLAYWLYPYVQRKLFKTRELNTIVIPTYNNHTAGLALAHHFR